MRLKMPTAILATAVLAVGLSSVTTASAAQTAVAGQVFCVNKATKVVRALKACNPKTERTLTIQEAQQGIASQGPRGERGLTGQQGQKGDPGRDGEDGKPGAQGEPGTAGETGARGDTGPAGAKGDPGKGLDGPFVLDLQGVLSLCSWDGSVKGYPRLRCKSGGLTPTPAPTPAATPTPTPTPTPDPDPPSTGNDPRFPTCGAANDAGYGPYRRGADPEYDWYQDRDGDGVVCER